MNKNDITGILLEEYANKNTSKYLDSPCYMLLNMKPMHLFFKSSQIVDVIGVTIIPIIQIRKTEAQKDKFTAPQVNRAGHTHGEQRTGNDYFHLAGERWSHSLE